MILALLLLFHPTAAADCSRFVPGPEDAPFAQEEATPGAVILEIRLVEPVDPAALRALVAPLEARGLLATLLVEPSVAAALSPALAPLAAAGHDIGLLLEVDEAMNVPPGSAGLQPFDLWWAMLRKHRKAVRRAAGSRVPVVAMDQVPPVAEAAVEQSAFKVVLPLDQAERGPTRRVRAFGDLPGRARLVPEGPYPDGCGALLPAWTPAALDRAARYAPAGSPGRVALPMKGARPELLARWLDEVLLPSGVRVVPASQAGSVDLRPEAAVAVVDPLARPVDREMIEAAARALLPVHRLPRTLPGNLNLTEVFVALVQLLGTDEPPLTVHLGRLGPPPDVGSTRLPAAGLPMEATAIRAAAARLKTALQGTVPAVVEVDGLALTAAEFLLVMAQVAAGEAPVARAVDVPDPFAPGAGWGRSGAEAL